MSEWDKSRLSVARRHNRCDLFRKPLFRLRNFDTKDTVFRKFHTEFLFPPVNFPDSPLIFRKTGGFPPPSLTWQVEETNSASHPLVWRSPVSSLFALCGSFLLEDLQQAFSRRILQPRYRCFSSASLPNKLSEVRSPQARTVDRSASTVCPHQK